MVPDPRSPHPSSHSTVRSTPPPDTAARTVATLRCGSCGGSFQEGDAACPWCGGGIALEERGRSDVCAHCAARAPVGAEWCPSCGERLGQQHLAPLAESARCPACSGELRQRDVGAHQLTECAGCGGLWVASSTLDELCRAAERTGIAQASALAPRPLPAVREPERVVYRACPACSEPMSRRNWGVSSGVVVDVCPTHGIWLDAHELERVLAWVRAGGPERERQRRVERAQRAQQAATLPGRAVEMPFETPRAADGPDLLDALSWLLKRLS